MDDAASVPEPPQLAAGALRALAHPLRVAIFDILSQRGPQTASTLADLTGESTGSTSYHLRALAKHGLIVEAPGTGRGRERWWRRPEGAVSFVNPEALETPAGRAASQVVMTEFLNRRHGQLLDFIEHGIRAGVDDWSEAAVVSTSTTHLTLEQLSELTARLQAVVDEFTRAHRDQRGPGVRTVTIRTDAFPLPLDGA
ncbi:MULTISPECIES: helix-turn-helix domain-containing protein [unclassified Pseudactinotalea]|uniref:winged helix-turn-helix domain-containing protein n=1 Tax=unclassified Pseudactinotalea TaxID=2649176 RepID=UPI00128CD942|nr:MULTISPECIES: helix-turn-helix domain-containing protein [unclassified Pseudactinotalea]MPV49723.1 helix-turn-helix domain-containing protein [Pseudactinotalea sp. HY160]QGH69604.1 helix-turn-helix domain-containing protein [Pseudactinotalea sp. HY158]